MLQRGGSLAATPSLVAGPYDDESMRRCRPSLPDQNSSRFVNEAGDGVDDASVHRIWIVTIVYTVGREGSPFGSECSWFPWETVGTLRRTARRSTQPTQNHSEGRNSLGGASLGGERTYGFTYRAGLTGSIHSACV